MLAGERDGVAVVLTQEDTADVVDGGEVHRLVEIPLGGGSVPEGGEGDAVAALQPLRPGQPDGVDHVAPHGDGGGQDGDVLGRAPTALVARPPGEQQLPGVALGPHQGGVPIGGHHPVLGIEGGGGADLGRLLALEGSVGGQASLLLEGGALAVVGAGEDHGPVQAAGELEVEGSRSLQVPARCQPLPHVNSRCSRRPCLESRRLRRRPIRRPAARPARSRS